MIGKRVDADENGFIQKLSPGEYGWSPKFNYWIVMTPNGHAGNLSSHKVVEHEDRTITVNPSILVTADKKELWHGWLEKGVWRNA